MLYAVTTTLACANFKPLNYFKLLRSH